jgi:hypothetical protein
MPELKFVESTHSYYLDGEPLPSVSKVKEPLTDFLMVDPAVLDRAAKFGTAVHRMCELYLADDLDYSSLDEPLLGCLEAFQAWLSEVKPFEIQTGVLIDIKSRKFDRVADPIQLAAYYELWKENRAALGNDPIIERPIASIKYRYAGTPDIIIPPKNGATEFSDLRVLYLGRDGKYQYAPAYDRQAWPMFGHLLGDVRRKETTMKLIQSWRNR